MGFAFLENTTSFEDHRGCSVSLCFASLGFEGGFLLSFFTILSFFWWISRGEFEAVIGRCLVTRKMGLFS